MLVDSGVFAELGARDVKLPLEPEQDVDPKATFDRLLREGRIRIPRARLYSFFGERLSLARLRTLPAFTSFERELEDAVHELDPPRGER